ncbi:hypothetical protein DXA98_13435 [Lachnospiraceae bacterium OF09-6]|nr:hypothetical protein DXA98_13435 [Lachnospiraceae bacterium OF09-6]
MKAEKDKKTGKWLIQYRYTDWQGKRRKSTKRGFATKREAEEWLRNFLITQKADFDMKFEDFWKMYCADMETRLREHTMRTKKYIVELKILPYFGNKRVNDITAADIRQWQNELIKIGYSPTYLKTINNQLSAIFNYAVRYYDLKSNPCAKAGSMGKSKAEEMDFWTGEEFRRFIDSVMNKRLSYMAFVSQLKYDNEMKLTDEYWINYQKGKGSEEFQKYMEDLTDMQNHVLPYLQSFCNLEEKGVKERREQQIAERYEGRADERVTSTEANEVVKDVGKTDRKPAQQKQAVDGKDKKLSIHERLEINKRIIQEKQGKDKTERGVDLGVRTV